ncbi:2266_t:CDS:2 [Cetraspora pellucida]|uniref:2266_t:CDS:1 n=1 Tax=Cetraspora pellucida TaxID=1433469 RepID=A0A9N9A8Y0_9GLOM|nr:2266_t:CDS:2 [Cetraspora pellucida]
MTERQPKSVKHNIPQEVDVNIEYVEVDYLDVGDLIEHQINELMVNKTINPIYQAHLLVNMDIIPNIMTKDVAALVIAEIEYDDDYS